MEKKDEKLLRDARKYALCIIGETPHFKGFAIEMIDYLGIDILPYIKEIYEEMNYVMFARGIKMDDLNVIKGISEDQILEWHKRYLEMHANDEERRINEFNENIDELQFLVRTYRQSSEFQNMIEFVGKFHYIAPYNAMLIQMQKPGSTFVLKGRQWKEYGRKLKPNAQQLIVLRQFGPIQCLFDVSDTETIPGFPPTEDSELLDRWNNSLLRANGDIDKNKLKTLIFNLPVYGVYLDDSFSAANTYGGYIMPYEHLIDIPENRNSTFKYKSRFLISVNRIQKDEDKFHTICHELGHLFCRHLSYNPSKERMLTIKEREFEAETVAWIMCKRHGIDNPSEEYLAMYAKDGEIPFCSADLIMKAVTEIEKMIKEDIYVTKSLWYKEDKVYKSYYDKMIKKEKPAKQKKTKF